MAFVLDEVAPHGETRTKTFTIAGHETEVTYHPNRLTMEDTRRPDDEDAPDEDGDTADSVAARLVALVARWDWTGPLKRLDGSVAVEAGVPVPLDVETVRLIPLPLTKALNEAIVEAELGGNARRRRRR